jgi:rubrerythrin
MGKTKKNLAVAFMGESQARNKYTYFGEIAKKEGYHYIAKIFAETADKEKKYAESEFKLLGGIKSTVDNVQMVAKDEIYQPLEMYLRFAEEADAEGQSEAACLFRQIVKIENHHRDRFKKILKMIKNGTVYKRDEPIDWKCGICGYTITANEPPNRCSYCLHAKEYYEPSDMSII